MKNHRVIGSLAFFVLALCATPALAEDSGSPLFENLVPVEDRQVGMAYIDPEADFSVFKRVQLLDTYVAFRSGWRRDQNRGTRGVGVTSGDMDRIKADVSTLFNEVLAERLQVNDGYEIVEESGDDVLLIRAAIIDLDVTAPDTRGAGRSRTYTAEPGEATLYIELFDSVSGQILGRAADRQVVRNSSGWVTWTNRVTNTQDARRMFSGWADQLRSFLDSHYSD